MHSCILIHGPNPDLPPVHTDVLELSSSGLPMIAARPAVGTAAASSRWPTQSPVIVSTAAPREVVRRVVHSATFGCSERLGGLFTYVCHLQLKGREPELSERKSVKQSLVARKIMTRQCTEFAVR